MAHANRMQRDTSYIRAVEQAVVEEITEEAYKQNTVYCSWQEIIEAKRDSGTRETVARTDPPAPEAVDAFPAAVIRRP